MSVPGRLLPNRTGIVHGLGATAFWPIAGMGASLVRRSKFLPGSSMPAYLLTADIQKPISSWKPFLTSRPISGIQAIIRLDA
jgi:hypothetical protein